ncbi:MAG: hypothetical protein JSU93_02125 [Methanobacteriota archaeon]|nr:MAG: hypothetical protein JSU93_02125 [Euryarchaeota archaeon]
MEIATPVLIGMGLVDPLVGELRRKRSSSAVQISLPLAAYAIICFTMLSLMVDKEAASIITISTIGSLLAVGAERLDLPRVDDDFLMIIVPGSLMSIIWLMM